MQTELIKKGIISGWALSLAVLASTGNVTSVGAWTVLVGLGVLSPLVMLKFWDPPSPAKSMSESIRDVIS